MGINQNITKKNEKKRKDKRSKCRSTGNEPKVAGSEGGNDERKMEETSVYSASILSANCLSNATQMLQELSGYQADMDTSRITRASNVTSGSNATTGNEM